MTRQHLRQQHSRPPPRRRDKGPTASQVEAQIRLIRVFTGAMVGLLVTGTFSLILSALVALAIVDRTQSSQLLTTAGTLIGPAIGAIVGYFFGRAPRGR